MGTWRCVYLTAKRPSAGRAPPITSHLAITMVKLILKYFFLIFTIKVEPEPGKLVYIFRGGHCSENITNTLMPWSATWAIWAVKLQSNIHFVLIQVTINSFLFCILWLFMISNTFSLITPGITRLHSRRPQKYCGTNFNAWSDPVNGYTSRQTQNSWASSSVQKPEHNDGG